MFQFDSQISMMPPFLGSAVSLLQQGRPLLSQAGGCSPKIHPSLNEKPKLNIRAHEFGFSYTNMNHIVDTLPLPLEQGMSLPFP